MNFRNFSRELLKTLFVIQEVSNKDRAKKLGRGYSTAVRLNPFNPLSYIAFISAILIGMLLFGIYGFWKEVDHMNPFKWN